MSNHPKFFDDWQVYPLTLDPIHVAWLKSAKKSKTDFGATKKISLVNEQK
jgi:acyl-[acyl-carrier-protein]-phospholipid O-acyltransferase / long-chain-fatty-acid--[acyl-carrier-protein] ligase